ncbi:MAG: OB-fold nucleic acid binding domain-containing protein [Prochlorothrix sp.]
MGLKIVSRRSLGTQPVYDIGLAQDHNFLLHTGLVASNCFNKSHSTAYGYVTFQTAYLKANYPVEYMAALLTVNSSNQDKVQKYIANCQAMGIEVELPDVNRSGEDFTPLESRILFGLSAIRNVGEGPIRQIIKARSEGGPFQNLADFCDRVDTVVRNKRVLESLIHCGALDKLEPQANRRQMASDLPLVLDWAQSRARDRDSGQGNLFDLGGSLGNDGGNTAGSFESAPKAEPVVDYTSQDRLRREKELLGFYVSDHPLKTVRRSSWVLAPVNVSDMGDYVDYKGTVSAIVMLPEVKPVVTKKGDRMAIVTMEDLSGQIDAVVFPKAFERVGEQINSDARLMVWGKVDRRDEQLQFIIEDAEPVEEVRMVMVEIDARSANDVQEQHRLRTILQGNQGDRDQAKVPVVAIIHSDHRRQFVRLGPQFRVQDPNQTVQALLEHNFQARVSALVNP